MFFSKVIDSIRTKLINKIIFLVIVFILLEAFILSFIIIIRSSSTQLNVTKNNISIITKLLSNQISGSVYWEIKDKVIDELADLKTQKDFKFILVYKGNDVLEGINTEDALKFNKLYELTGNEIKINKTKDYIILSCPIFYQEEIIGYLIIGYSLDSYNKNIRDNILYIGFSGFILLVVLIIIFTLIGNQITRGLALVTNLLKKISEGEIKSLKGVKIKQKDEVGILADVFDKMSNILKDLISKIKEITINLNSSSKEIEAASQEQTSAANEHASGITEVSATLEELTITAKQITKNVGELVLSSEEIIKSLHENEKQLIDTVSQLDDVGNISRTNTNEIGELGKRSVLINEMVELIKEVANKTNILSINASIEASRSGEAGTGFSVVAAEIRELSKETITSAKKVEKAAKEIQDFLNSIIISSESESSKVISSGKIVKTIYDNIENIVSKVNNNYTFTQKIDVSIKQQESGSKQASDTMRQMAEIARQSAETTRQTLLAVKDIVNFSAELDVVIKKFKSEE